MSSSFLRTLNEVRPADKGGRRWLYVPYDQLSDVLGPLAREEPGSLGIVVVESTWKARRRPYHRQKLALLLANQRHFALEQARRGVAVRFVAGDAPFGTLLAPIAREIGPLRMMEAAERELRVDLAALVASGALEVVRHEGWLTKPEDFRASQSGPPWRMDAFYRHVRRATGILMECGKPVGGKFSFDAENRKAWRGDPPAPEAPRFAPDPITEEVLALVETRFADHPGTLVPEALPATRADALVLWRWARTACLPHFGPYEDALSTRSRGLFHTRLAPLLNLHRLTPREVLDGALADELPLACREGFVRQVLGWREFVRHVHRETDGFRAIAGQRPEVAATPGDAGWARASGSAWPASAAVAELDGGAKPSFLEAHEPLPAAFWGRPSGLACLDRVVEDVWSTGYTHHIARLMVLSNLATLLAVEPRELTDWFWVAFADAYDWVVEPNVLAMGTFGVGELMTTKPYVSGAAYLDRMSDFCATCRFDPRTSCPVTALYWDFLARNQERLAGNPRLAMPLRSLARRSAERRAEDTRIADELRRSL